MTFTVETGEFLGEPGSAAGTGMATGHEWLHEGQGMSL